MASVNEALLNLSHRYPLSERYSASPVPGTESPGFSATFRNSALHNKEPLSVLHPKLATLSDCFTHAVKNFPDSNCLGVRKFHNTRKRELDDFYSFQTYKEVELRKNNIASGIIYMVTHNQGYDITKHSKDGKPNFVVSLLSTNRLEWLLVDIATRDFSLPNTALYPTLGKNSSKYILELTESPIIFLSKDQITKILDLKLANSLPNLLLMISFDEFNYNDHELFEKAKKSNITLVDFRTVEKTGERNLLPTDFNLPTPDTIYTYSFTSGTTGNPKGVILTHRIAAAAVSTAFFSLQRPVSRLNIQGNLISNRDDRGKQITALCSLPLAHIYERQITNFALCCGYAVCMLSKGTPASLFDDIKAAKPHYLCSVPRVWNKLEGSIKEVISKQYIDLAQIKDHEGPEVDKLLIRNFLRTHYGFDNMRYGVTGSAPLGVDTINFLKDKLGIGFCVAYGSTESFAGITFGDPFEQVTSNSSGPPGISCELKLREVPSMGYTPKDKPLARGELLLRGPQIFKEYYKNPKATKESFTEDGWFCTGDIAAFDSYGRVFIIDRVKNFFKLSQGEYVTPEKIENIYLANSPLLTQIFVTGDSLQNYLVGVAGIAPDSVIKILKDGYGINVTKDEIVAVLKDPKLKALILGELNKHVAKCDLQGFEKVHNLHFDLEPLKVEDEVLTPTLKLKRNNARKKFEEILQNLYEEGSLVKNHKL